MSTITPFPNGMGVASLLQSSGSGSGLFSAISGGSNASGGGGIFSAISPGATNSSIDGLLRQQKYSNQKNGLLANVAQRLSYMQQGKYEAKANWEKVAAYAMQTGQPITVNFDEKGAIQAVPQSQADLSRFNPRQQDQLYKAMNDIATMAGKIKGNDVNQEMIDKLTGASYDLQLVRGGLVTAKTDWEKQASSLMDIHRPFKIALDAQGNLMVQDQLTAPMDDLPANAQTELRNAIQDVPKLLNGTKVMSRTWQAEAKSFSDNNIPYYLEADPTIIEVVPDVDATTGIQKRDASGNGITKAVPLITAKENSAENIVPKFLKTAPYPDIGDNTPLLKKAAEFIKAQKPYFLDFDPGGHVTVKEATAQNLISYGEAKSPFSQTGQLTAASILSILA